MFKFGKKNASKKLQKAAPPAEDAPEVVPTKVFLEEESPLAKAKAAANKKSRHVVEKGLPSFEEFGAKGFELDEGGDEKETLKPATATPDHGKRALAVRPESGYISRSPSPQPPRDYGDRSPIGHDVRTGRAEPRALHNAGYPITDSPSRSGSVLPIGDYSQYDASYDPYHHPSHPNSRPPSTRRSDPHAPEDPYHSRQWPESQSLEDFPPYTASNTRQYDPYHQPAYPPARRYEAGPQYPSPGTDRYDRARAEPYALEHPHDRMASARVRPPPWEVRPSIPSPTPPRRYQEDGYRDWDHTGAPDARMTPYAPVHHRHPGDGHRLPFSDMDYPPEHPYYTPPRARDAYSLYHQHQRSRTVDSEPLYQAEWSGPPPHHSQRAPLPPQAFPASQAYPREEESPQYTEPLRRRTYSLQQFYPSPRDAAADPRPQPSYHQPRSQRHLEYAGPDHQLYEHHSQEPQWHHTETARYPTQQAPVIVPPHSRTRVSSLTQQLTGLQLQPQLGTSASRPPSSDSFTRWHHEHASPVPSPTKSNRPLHEPPVRYSLYHAPPASRSSSSFDFSSSSTPSSPSPVLHTPGGGMFTEDPHHQQLTLTGSGSRTSLHSVEEADHEEEDDSGWMKSNDRDGRPAALPTLQDFKRRRASQPADPVPSRRSAHEEQESEYRYGRVTSPPQSSPLSHDRADVFTHQDIPPVPWSVERASELSGASPTFDEGGYEKTYDHDDEAYEDRHTKEHYYHETTTAHNSPATQRTVTTGDDDTAGATVASPSKDVPTASRSGPNTPNRRRTIVVQGPRGPRSPANGSPYGARILS